MAGLLWKVTGSPRAAEALKFLVWLLLAALVALIAYASIRGYLSPDMLLNFANSFYC